MEAVWTKADREKYKREIDVRDVLNGLLYDLGTGCQWRAVPKDLPPKSTLFIYFDLWNRDGTQAVLIMNST